MHAFPGLLLLGLTAVALGCSASSGATDSDWSGGLGGSGASSSTTASLVSSSASDSSSASSSTGAGGASSSSSIGAAGGSGGAGQGGGTTSSSTTSSTTTTSLPPSDVDVVITADNAYSFGYGTIDAINTYVAGARATSAGQIFNCGEGPEGYTVPGAGAPTNGYLYIVSWDDASTSEGVLGQFSRDGVTIYTGDPRFEVCATGIATYNGTTSGPSQDEVNAQIARCNSGGETSSSWSRGWVNLTDAVTSGAIGKLAVGEENKPGDDRPGYGDGTGTFPGVCVTGAGGLGPNYIDQAAHWMWYNTGSDPNPFKAGGGNRYHAYLIFRLRAGIIHI